MPFFGSPLRTACLCSLNLTFSVLFVSPTYTSSHSLQGISYTTPVCYSLGTLDFTFTRSCLKVLIGLKTGFTPSGAQTFSIFSLRPLMYGVYSTFGASSSCCVLGGSERGEGWAERVFFVRASGKPFAWKTWVRWSVSFSSLRDGRCCVLYPSCTSRLQSLFLGDDGSGRGCTSQCGWASGTLKSLASRLPW